MNELERFLYKTRKSALEAYREFDIEYSLSLEQCNSCGIWLKNSQLSPDLDGLPICRECEHAYGL